MIKEANSILGILEDRVGSSSIQQEAWDSLVKFGLPTKKSESYKFTNMVAALEKYIDWSFRAEPNTDKVVQYPEEGSHLYFVNGVYDSEKSSLQNDLRLELGEVTDGKKDPFSLLNQALAPNEITISSGSMYPIFIYHLNESALSCPRIKVKVESGHSMRLYEKIFPGSHNSFTNSYIEYDLAENSFAYHTKIQNYNQNTYSHETVFARVKRDGQFYSNNFSFEGAMIRNNLTINLEGENCEGHMYGVFLLDKNSHVDNNTSVDHIMPNSYSNELYKGILDEKSTGVFNGKIYVRQDAQKTNAFQSNNNILLSEDATIHTKPQLEIWADDVKCSHGCTSGQLDEDAIFYLRARGINHKTAKAMLLNAFALETMDHIKMDSVENEVKDLIAQKLS